MKKELSLKDFFVMFKRYLAIIIATTFAGALLGFGIMSYWTTPMYSSQTELLVNQRSDQQIIQYSEVQTNIQLINTYRAMIMGNSVLSQVDQNLDGKYGVETLRNALSVDQPENSQTFYITSTMDSPESAQEVVEEVLKTFEDIISEVYGDTDISLFVLDHPTLDPNPDTPGVLLYVIGGTLLGLLISVVTILYIEIMDSTVKDDDFFAVQGLMNLGIIYENPHHKKKETISSTNTNRTPVEKPPSFPIKTGTEVSIKKTKGSLDDTQKKSTRISTNRRVKKRPPKRTSRRSDQYIESPSSPSDMKEV